MKMARMLAGVLLFLFAGSALAQTNKGGLTGTVFDETGAVVAGAKVVITNLGTGQAIELTTSEGGAFSAPLLDPVEYRVAVESPGFKPSVLSKVKVDTASTATVKITLKVGAVTSEVSVSAEAPLVNVTPSVELSTSNPSRSSSGGASQRTVAEPEAAVAARSSTRAPRR